MLCLEATENTIILIDIIEVITCKLQNSGVVPLAKLYKYEHDSKYSPPLNDTLLIFPAQQSIVHFAVLKTSV